MMTTTTTMMILVIKSFYTNNLLEKETAHKDFLRKNLSTERLLHTKPFTHKWVLVRTHPDVLMHRSFDAQQTLQRDTFTHRRIYTQVLLRTES